VGVQYWTAPADQEHPYGHGRIESVITSLISLLLALVAGGLVYRALTTLGETDGPPSWAAFAVALASIATCSSAVVVSISRPSTVTSLWGHGMNTLSPQRPLPKLAHAHTIVYWRFIAMK
jgi:divalent metal cation (Fe/Co/Zn/Cd) transporter